MSGSSTKTTTDHDEIKRWVEEHDGHPATVAATEDGDEPGVLRIDFPGGKDDRLERISWEDFFAKFDEEGLALLYQEQKADGGDSTFAKFVAR
ncbi:hypothetical protein ACVU7I_13435 [Patulibacter sp. S7RM1-6]